MLKLFGIEMENDWLYEFQKYIKKFSLFILFSIFTLLILVFLF